MQINLIPFQFHPDSAIENKGVVVGVNPETNEQVVERTAEEKHDEDSSDAYLVDALTEVFTKTNPFGTPSYPSGAIEGSLILFISCYTTVFRVVETQMFPLKYCKSIHLLTTETKLF